MRIAHCLSVFALACALFDSAQAGEPGDQRGKQSWHEVARHKLGGSGGWDLLAVDAATRRVYITRADHLAIANVDTGETLGEVPGLHRAHGVVVLPELGRGFVSSGGDDRLAVFDLRSLKPLAQIETGKSPDAMVYDAGSRRLFVFNAGSNDASVIDPATNKVVATVALPGKPELAVSDGAGKVFVNLEDKSAIALIDAKSYKVASTWPLGSCEEPTGLAFDVRNSRLFSVCANRMMAVLDARDGRLVATAPIGEGPDGATFDAHSGNVFSSNSDGTLSVVHEDDPDHFRALAPVATPPRARTIALDEKKHAVVLPFAQFAAVPPATADNPHPRPPMLPDSFGFVVVGQH